MQWLLEPYQFEFFRTGSLVALLAGVMCGCWASTSCCAA
jgi:ABC-type Mn2+/Zn2+ transport system permease subunit